MKIYLDIDGVILKRDLTMPDYGVEFISFLITNHDCYWLTTHCRGGNNNAINHSSEYYPLSTVEHLKMIKQTNWIELKTEAIDLNSDFIWLEDFPFESEKMVYREDELKLIQKRIER